MLDLVALVVAFGIPVGVMLRKDKVEDVLQSGLSAYLASLALVFYSLLIGTTFASAGWLGTLMGSNIILGIIIVPLVVTAGYLLVSLAAFYGVRMKP